jgi:threonine synthase
VGIARWLDNSERTQLSQNPPAYQGPGGFFCYPAAPPPYFPVELYEGVMKVTRPYRAVFRCTAGCPEDHSIWQPLYRCPRCGALLQVEHDLEALRDRSPAAWMRCFDDRYKRTTWPYGSGVWGKKEWICPELRNDNVVSMDEGGTNMFWAERFGQEIGIEDLWVKQCGNSHTGSFKDLGMTVLVSVVKQMIADGAGVRAVACASTGDTSAALAAYAAAAGIPAIVILPRGRVTPAQLVQPLANGARVLALDTDFDGCMTIVRRLAEEEGVYLANSMNSLRLEGQKTLSIEIVQQFDWEVPDVIIIPGGNLGNVSAIGAGFELMLELGVISKRPRIVVAQAAAANPLYVAYRNNWVFEPMTAQPTIASAIQIGNPVSVGKAIRTLQRFNGIVEQATESELADAAARADRTGMFNCPHTGVALAALEKLVARGDIRATDRTIVISTANGLKFTEFKVAYHTTGLAGVPSRQANPPVELPNEYDVVRRAVDSVVAAESIGSRGR